jgi:hypothetical protein
MVGLDCYFHNPRPDTGTFGEGSDASMCKIEGLRAIASKDHDFAHMAPYGPYPTPLCFVSPTLLKRT